MPNVMFANSNEALYKIGCVSTYSRKFQFSFYKGVNKLSVTHACRIEWRGFL